MSHYTPMHARDGQRRDALAAWLGRARERAVRLIPSFRRALPRATAAPAPDGRPAQAPRPADPPGATSARCGPGQPPAPGAAAAGTGTDAGVPPAPVTAAADAVPPSAGAAAPLPRPHPSRPPWPGQPDHLWPGGPVTAPAGSRRSNEQQFARAPQHPMPAYKGDYRPTAPFRAVSDLPPVNIFRPHYERHEARRDSTARWTA